MKTKILGLLAVGLLAGPMAAQAVPVQWSLNYANNGSGSLYTVNGSFIYDADSNVFSSINVFVDDVQGNTVDATYTMIDPANTNTATFFRFWNSLAADRTGAQFLRISSAGLTNAGGVISLLAGAGYVLPTRCTNATCSGQASYGIVISPDPANGSLVGIPVNVPEPGTLALLGLGLAGLGLSRRRKAN